MSFVKVDSTTHGYLTKVKQRAKNAGIANRTHRSRRASIAGLLIHGLWTNRREQSGKFSDKPLGKLETESTDSPPAEEPVAKQEIADDDFEVVKVSKSSKQEPSFGAPDNDYSDPLLDSEPETSQEQEEPIKPKHTKQTTFRLLLSVQMHTPSIWMMICLLLVRPMISISSRK